MSNDNFNLRGIEMIVEDPSDNNNYFYYYHFFMDLTSGLNLGTPLGPLNFTGIPAGGADITKITAAYSGEPLYEPAPDTQVRTYYLGTYLLPAGSTLVENAHVEITGLIASDKTTPMTAKGDPNSRRPPIVKFNSGQVQSGMGDLSATSMAIGVQSDISSHQLNMTTTYHSHPDYFAIILLQMQNTVNPLTATLHSVSQNETSIHISGSGAMGNNIGYCVYDCNLLNGAGAKNNNESLQLPRTCQNIDPLQTGTFPIWWAQF